MELNLNILRQETIIPTNEYEEIKNILPLNLLTKELHDFNEIWIENEWVPLAQVDEKERSLKISQAQVPTMHQDSYYSYMNLNGVSYPEYFQKSYYVHGKLSKSNPMLFHI